MALPSAPSPLLEESNALAIRSPGDLDIREYTDGISNEHSLLKRDASPMSGGIIALWYAAAPLAAFGGLVFSRTGSKIMLVFVVPALFAFVLSMIYGTKNSLDDIAKTSQDIDIRDSKRNNDPTEEENRRIRNDLEKVQLQIQATVQDLQKGDQRLKKIQQQIQEAEFERKKKQMEFDEEKLKFDKGELKNKMEELKRQRVKWADDDADGAQKLQDDATDRERKAIEFFKNSLEKTKFELADLQRKHDAALKKDEISDITKSVDTLTKIINEENDIVKSAKELAERMEKAKDRSEQMPSFKAAKILMIFPQGYKKTMKNTGMPANL
ncbi:hypothetical protein N7492_003852 [Penicillium capsulatum]|uniref:Uncharacterized protein n=1 Tax=Penicillium capsulatum TaxID=69766 RepID=A0A9W9IMU2_9EURO|nr:hypothetical protein N7492_003852 [Penicillium capsulatum]KAJ6121566.1 hypothetical protein N7512_004031 [Penicillium capsulatum]